MVGNPVCVPAVSFSSLARAERQTELSDHGEDNLQQNTTTVEQTGNSRKRNKDMETINRDSPTTKGEDVSSCVHDIDRHYS